MWAWCGGVGVAWLRRCGRVCMGRGWRKNVMWAAVGGSLSLVCAQAAHHTPAACLREGGLFLDPDDDQLTEARPLEMNEMAALTHTALLKQASAVAVDAATQLLHRTLRATLDFSQQYRKQVEEVTELLEYCTTMLRHTQEHDRLWELVVAARGRTDSLKQQLRDLNLLLTYACATLENTAMAAFISGNEFSASAARQMTDSAKLELTMDERKTEGLEMQYIHTHTRYMEAAQRVMDEAKTDDGDSDVENNNSEWEGIEESKEDDDKDDGRREGEMDDG